MTIWARTLARRSNWSCDHDRTVPRQGTAGSLRVHSLRIGDGTSLEKGRPAQSIQGDFVHFRRGWTFSPFCGPRLAGRAPRRRSGSSRRFVAIVGAYTGSGKFVAGAPPGLVPKLSFRRPAATGLDGSRRRSGRSAAGNRPAGGHAGPRSPVAGVAGRVSLRSVPPSKAGWPHSPS